MTDFNVNIPDLSPEFQFLTSRSSGPGGQNVNKVNSKVEIRKEQKDRILSKLASKITSEAILIIVSQRNRSQLSNKEDAICKLYALLSNALQPDKPRKNTRPTKSSVEKRLNVKRINSRVKQNRQKPEE